MQTLPDTNKRILYIIFSSLAVYIAFRYLLGIFFPFLAAWILSGLLLKLRNGLQNFYHTSRKTGNFLAGVIVIFIAGGLLSCLALTIYRQCVSLVANYPTYVRFLSTQAESICSYCDKTLQLSSGTTKTFATEQLTTLIDKKNPGHFLMDGSMEYMRNIVHFIAMLFITLLATFFLLKDRNRIINQYRSSAFYQKSSQILHSLRFTVLAYLKAECIIMLIIAIVCTLALLLIHAPYPLAIGIGIALLDALPVFGSGIILVPWAVYYGLTGHFFQAGVLLVVYIICVLTRELLEARLIGRQVGLLPFYMLLSMYIGLRLFGIFGFILGPTALLIIKTIAKESYSLN